MTCSLTGARRLTRHTLKPEGNVMSERTKQKLDRIAFAGVSLALIGYLVWFVAILPG